MIGWSRSCRPTTFLASRKQRRRAPGRRAERTGRPDGRRTRRYSRERRFFWEPTLRWRVGSSAPNVGCAARSCENTCRCGVSEKSTRQNGPGSTIVASPRVEGPPNLLAADVFTRPRLVAVIAVLEPHVGSAAIAVLGARRITNRFRPILLKNSARARERAKLQKSTSQIDPGSTIATSARVK